MRLHSIPTIFDAAVPTGLYYPLCPASFRRPNQRDAMKHLITILCIFGATACYFLWMQNGAAILIAAGILLELTFWVRSSRARRLKKQAI
jgi:hypothetical protein